MCMHAVHLYKINGGRYYVKDVACTCQWVVIVYATVLHLRSKEVTDIHYLILMIPGLQLNITGLYSNVTRKHGGYQVS